MDRECILVTHPQTGVRTVVRVNGGMVTEMARRAALAHVAGVDNTAVVREAIDKYTELSDALHDVRLWMDDRGDVHAVHLTKHP